MRSKLISLFTVIGAVTVLVLAANTVAIAATGKSLIAGKTTTTSKATTIKRTKPGTALAVVTKSSSNSPFAVNGKGKVTNLNADTVDGLHASAFAPYPKVIRGGWGMGGQGGSLADGISFGWTLPTAPTAHLIEIGDPLPAGCAGTGAAPDAAPGHLCVFVTGGFGTFGQTGVCSSQNVCPGADRFGANLFAYPNDSTLHQWRGTWAVRAPSVSAARIAPGAASGGSAARVATGR